RTGQDFLADRVLYRRTGPWAFPPGTVFVKHFDLPIDETDPEATRRLETRLLVLSRNGGVYGATYRWDEDGRDASLLTDRVEEPIEIVRHDGSAGEQTWTYPSGADCLV